MSYFVDRKFVKEKLVRFLNLCHEQDIIILAVYQPSDKVKKVETLSYSDIGTWENEDDIEFYSKPSHNPDNPLFSLNGPGFLSIMGIKVSDIMDDDLGVCFRVTNDGSMMIIDPAVINIWKTL